MKTKLTIEELKRKYPDRSIIKNDSKNPTEIICEVEPASKHPDWSTAIVVASEVKPHYHGNTTEVYEVIKGKLVVYKAGEEHVLHEGEKVTIKPGEPHYAKGETTWFKVHSKPGWTLDDHIRLRGEELGELVKELEREYSPEGIQYSFAGYYDLGDTRREYLLFNTLSKLPRDIVGFCKNLFFISGNPEEAGAQYLEIGDKGFRGIIHFQSGFWDALKGEIEDGIAHEIAHAYLSHKYDRNLGKKQDKEMESEADKLASKWLGRKVTVGMRRFLSDGQKIVSKRHV